MTQIAAGQRLNQANLASLPPGIARPSYDRARLQAGIVHLGIGAFHRAHQAIYVDDLLARDFGPYGIIGVSLRNPGVRDRMSPQDGLYTLVLRDEDRVSFRVAGSVREVLVASEAPEVVLRRLVDPATRLVTLTITEKGYCLNPSRRLDAGHSDISHDLASPMAPRSAIGYLVEALRRMRLSKCQPPTIVSCDNLPGNGRLVRAALIDYAAAIDQGLARWIESEVRVPSSMIDRIVPATTESDLADVRAAIGLRDEAVVVAESFRQWVIEDSCAGSMPDFALVGAEIVSDVEPYERMKLRLLNGAHSTIAYLGQLAGIEHVAEAMARRHFRDFVRRMMLEEIAPTLEADFPTARLCAYSADVMRRFRNPALRHRTWQIAMDGSQKLPQRLLATVEERLHVGASVDALALAVAAWMRFLGRQDDSGAKIEISDPRAGELAAWASRALPAGRVVDNILDQSGIFPQALRNNMDFRKMLASRLAELAADGVEKVLNRRMQTQTGREEVRSL